MWAGVRDDGRAGRAALISGEAGIGKSRLAEHAAGVAALDGAKRLVLETREFDSAVPLHPVSAALERRFGLGDLDNDDDRYRRLQEELADVGATPALLSIAKLLGLGSEHDDEVPVEPSAVRELLLDGAEAWIRALTTDSPLALTIEDLHWADETTIALVDRLVQDLPENLLLLLTTRPGLEVTWPAETVLVLELERLPYAEVVQLAEFSASGTVREEQLLALAQASDGNPLYVSSLLGTVAMDSMVGETGVPENLGQLLTTIVEAPGVDRRLLGLLATIGRRLDVGFVADVLDQPTDEVGRRLSELEELGILEADAGARSTFVFHHALVQSAAYEHQVSSDRRLAHARIADAIERAPGKLELDSRSVARHLDLADRPGKAIPFFLSASRASQRKGALLEAERLADRGIELLAHLDDDDDRHDLEVKLHLQRALCITSIKGYASHAAAKSLERARELSQQYPDEGRDRLATPALIGLFTFYTAQGRRTASGEIVEELRSMIGPDLPAQVVDQLEALHIWHLGRYADSRNLYLDVIDRLEEDHRAGRRDHEHTPADSLVSAYIQMAPISWHLGDGDAAFEWIDKAVGRARSLDGSKAPFCEAWATSWLVYLQLQSGDPETALGTATESLAFCDRKGLAMFRGLALVFETVANAQLTPSAIHEERLQALVTAFLARGATTLTPYLLTHLAQLRAALGRPEDAIQGFTEAIRTAESIQEIQDVADAHRRRGLIRAELGRPEAARADLTQAATIAREQGAVILRLRALCDLIELGRPLGPSPAVVDVRRTIESLASPDRYPETARGRRLVEQATRARP